MHLLKSDSIDGTNSLQTGDATGKGNTCDTEEPELGCIFSEKLLVLDATEDEIAAAVADVVPTFTGTGGIFATDLVNLADFSVASVTGSVDLATIVNGGSGAAATGDASEATSDVAETSAAAVTTGAGENNDNAGDEEATTAEEATTTAAATTADAATTAATSAATTKAKECIAKPPTVVTTAITPVAPSGEPSQASCSIVVTTVAADETDAALATLTSATVGQVTSAGTNIQAFTGTLGGPAPPVVSSAGDRPFSVNGNTFTGAGAALSRSCDIQHNACANAANSGQLAGGIAQCETQVSECKAANALKKRRAAANGNGGDAVVTSAAAVSTGAAGSGGAQAVVMTITQCA